MKSFRTPDCKKTFSRFHRKSVFFNNPSDGFVIYPLHSKPLQHLADNERIGMRSWELRKETEEALIKKEAELLQSELLQEKNDEFIPIASHKLKMPITTIKAYTPVNTRHAKTFKIFLTTFSG